MVWAPTELGGEIVALARHGREPHHATAVTSLTIITLFRAQTGAHQAARAPAELHLEAAARAVRALPSLQADGSAGKSCRLPSWLCNNISAIAALPPRLPSI